MSVIVAIPFLVIAATAGVMGIVTLIGGVVERLRR